MGSTCEEVKGSRKSFRLHGINERSKFHNKLFSELEERDQKRLKNSVLRAFVVQQLDPDDDTSIYHIFERLNTGERSSRIKRFAIACITAD